jgi:acyl dehydratase
LTPGVVSFSSDEVLRFAEWCGDRNPLHVDDGFARQTHFGQRVVHGVLTVLESLASAGEASPACTGLDIEFRSAVVLGDEYRASSTREGNDLVVTLQGAGQAVLTVRCERATVDAPSADLTWVSAAATGMRREPAPRTLDELHRGVEVIGVYPLSAPAAPACVGSTGLSGTQARVLALCSYLTGMEVPGLR